MSPLKLLGLAGGLYLSLMGTMLAIGLAIYGYEEWKRNRWLAARWKGLSGKARRDILSAVQHAEGSHAMTEAEKQDLMQNHGFVESDFDPIGGDPVPKPAQPVPTPAVPEPKEPKPEPYYATDAEEEELFAPVLDHGWVDGPRPEDLHAFTNYGGPWRDSLGRLHTT